MKIYLGELIEEFSNNLKLDYDLKKKNWFNIGGTTKAFYKADSLRELIKFLKKIQNHEKICIFQPHRVSRLKDLKEEFSFAFKNADKVILFPIYTAGEKIKLGFSYINFAKQIIKNSKVQIFLIDDKFQLAKFIKANIYGKKIVIGMGAGTISGWMRELPKLLS